MRGNLLKKILGFFVVFIAITIVFFCHKDYAKASIVVTVSGAGSADYNGQYTENGSNGGKPAYSLDTNHWLWWKPDVTRWMLSPAIGMVPVAYHGNLDPDPPANPWTPITGVAPAPTLSVGSAPEPPPGPVIDPTVNPNTGGTTNNQGGTQSGTTTKSTSNQTTASNPVANAEKTSKITIVEDKAVDLVAETAKEVSDSVTPVAVLAVAAAATTLSTIATLAAVFFSQVSLKEFILMLLNYIFSIFRSKKKDKFGMVYDQLTKKPLPGAVVRLFEFSTMKLIATTVTDTKGHFYFTVKPGQYVLSVIKKNFIFPSKGVSREEHYLDRAYVGQTVEISRDASLINVKIPLDRTAKSKIHRNILLELLSSNAVRFVILICGSAISVFILIMSKSAANYIMTLLYILLWLMELITQNREIKFNRVLDHANKNPVDLAVIRIMSKEGKLIETNISDFKGRFVAKLSHLDDRISIDRVGYERIESEPRINGLLEGKKFYLNRA